MENRSNPFEPEVIDAIFKLVWTRKARERGKKEETKEGMEPEAEVGTSKESRATTAKPNALKLSCELLRIFVTEAVQRAAIIAEAEGIEKIEATHLERILPQLLLDF